MTVFSARVAVHTKNDKATLKTETNTLFKFVMTMEFIELAKLETPQNNAPVILVNLTADVGALRAGVLVRYLGALMGSGLVAETCAGGFMLNSATKLLV